MAKIKMKINNREVEVEEGLTVLEAAKQHGIHIPTLCYLKDVTGTGACRVCQVEVVGSPRLAAACVYPVREGLEIKTNSQRALDARRRVVELIVSNHSKDCLSCIRNTNCELQRLCQELGVREDAFKGDHTPVTLDVVSPGIVRNTSKCILCGRCVNTCQKVQGLGILGYMNRGFETKVGPIYDKSLADVNCMQCGQCINVCPVGALHEKEEIHNVIDALNDPTKHVIVQTAPAVRASLGEEFGMPIGTNVTGKMVTALKRLGFDRVFDTNTGADVTIMEEATEFIHRLNGEGPLPLITSCSPGWIKYIEMNYPENLAHVSSCKSPQEMFGALIKSYFAEKENIDPKKIFNVAVMPCVAKKYEKSREELSRDGMQDVDAVITTRELARMIKQANIEFTTLEDSEFDDPMGSATGAAAIFGTTGGVMEAALRTAQDTLTGKDLDAIDFELVRGEQGIKRGTVNVNGTDVKVVVASGLKNAKIIMEEIKEGKADYHFVEIMACPGGCVMGGGQPIKSSKIRSEVDVRALRAGALYTIDEKSVIRKSHENPTVKKIYEDYLEKPGSHKAHELLHTTYTAKPKYK